MFRVWETIPKQKHSKMMNNVTWNISVDVGFRYLIRLYFSMLGLKIVEISGTSFKVHINEMTACTYNDIVGHKEDEDSIPMYKDYMVAIKGCKFEGKRDVLISLELDHELIDGHGPLKGFEVLKLSNHDNSLASPNPNLVLPGQNVSYWPDQDLHHVLGPKNIMFTVAIRLLALVSIIIYTLCENLEARGTKDENIPSARAKQLCRRFSLADMRIATKIFSDAHLIGRGGFGEVYKGLIDNGLQTVAIKRLKSNSSQGASEFLMEIETLTEISTISSIKHQNVVQLLGYCVEGGLQVLVYEFAPQGSLHDILHGQRHIKGLDCEPGPALSWARRIEIAVGAAKGLLYLHEKALIHHNIRSSNVLLFDDGIAKITGLHLLIECPWYNEPHPSKFSSVCDYHHPGFGSAGRSVEDDIYSFGVVLLELLTGEKVFDHTREAGQQHIVTWVTPRLRFDKVENIVDTRLKGDYPPSAAEKMTLVATWCLNNKAEFRQNMSPVVKMLQSALQTTQDYLLQKQLAQS